ncbi:MAG: hypothetical protein KC800_31125 [Candidatus Eremiobacteraeota bacterium]|nr:hypothetical protein [Candidatus Eremiobacteraeota bacterium]
MSVETSAQISSQEKTKPQRPICCKSCGQVVAERGDCGAAVEGDEHTFRNPAGYSFHVMVFSRAIGCKEVGPATKEASWFPGYAWRIALCSECEGHLGWHFSGGEAGSFYGLIVTRLSGV